jgi:hypothetical protein
MKRTARCCFGALQIEVSGDPTVVLACHFIECQRRTGSVFGVSAYFLRRQIKIANTGRTYVRAGLGGRKARTLFCPDCGSTVFWEIDLFPDHLGVAVGAFAMSVVAVTNDRSWTLNGRRPVAWRGRGVS